MTKALRGLAIKTPWLKTVTKILLAGALAATCFNVALAGPYEDGVAAMNNMEDEKASAYNDNAKRQLQAISGYSPPPPPPEPKRGWFEQMAIDAYDRSTQPRVYNTPIAPRQEICGAWRCYSVGGGKEQCFRDCG